MSYTTQNMVDTYMNPFGNDINMSNFLRDVPFQSAGVYAGTLAWQTNLRDRINALGTTGQLAAQLQELFDTFHSSEIVNHVNDIRSSAYLGDVGTPVANIKVSTDIIPGIDTRTIGIAADLAAVGIGIATAETGIGAVAAVLAGVKTITDIINATTAGTADAVAALPDYSSTFSGIIDRLINLQDRAGNIETDALTIQFLLTGASGHPSVDGVFPPLSLRNLLSGVQYWAPGTGNLFDWVSRLARVYPPARAGHSDSLGAVSGSGVLALREGWGFGIDLDPPTAGFGKTSSSASPVYEELGKLAFGAHGGWAGPYPIHYRNQVWIPVPVDATSVSIDLAPGIAGSARLILPMGIA